MAAPMSMDALLLFSLVLLILPVSADVMVDDEFEGVTSFTVEHSFDSGPDLQFSKRGTITVRSLKGGIAHFSKPSSLSTEDLEKLKDLVDKNGIYRLRIPLRKPDSDLGIQHIYSFTRACALYESRLTDFVTINVDQSGEIIGVSMITQPGICTGAVVDENLLEEFNSTVEIVQPSVGPSPDTQSYIDKMKREEQEKVKGAEGDNRSFFVKYWMYIVPVFIFMLIASNADPGGGGGR